MPINLQNGKVTYNEFHIDFSVPYSDQIDALTEDLLQVEYDNGYILDVGWYPEFDSSGCFNVCVVTNCEWDKPIFSMRCGNESELENTINAAVQIILECKQF